MTFRNPKAKRGGWLDAEQARAAAKRASEARIPLNVNEPVLLVLRMPHPSPLLAWEVRKYSSIVLARGEGYATEALARAAGGLALSAICSASTPSEEPANGPAPGSELGEAVDIC